MPAELRKPASRALAHGPDWAVWEVNCTLGPHDRPFEERHAHTSISAVLSGTFQYRSLHGSALLYPGSFLLGNAGACFECGHEHGTGDRCVAFGFAPPLFEEIAAAVAGTSRFRFDVPMLPALPALTPVLVDVEGFAHVHGAASDEFALGLAERVIHTLANARPRVSAASARDQRRISDALRFIDDHHGQATDLTRLAQIACMSKYHFLRTFRKIVGTTPHQYLLDVRLRRSAVRIRDTSASIADIAAEAGFGDLATFYRRFRTAFGVTPRSLRAAR